MPSVPFQHYSGILVVTLPGQIDPLIRALAGKPGVTVSIRDPKRDRLIVVLESSSRDGLEALHHSVRALPGVVTADPVVHYVDEHPEEPVPGN